MKRLLIVTTLLCTISLLAYSQNFVSQDNKWIITDTWFNINGGELNTHHLFWFDDEIEIGQKSYLQLYSSELGTTDVKEENRLFREESDGKVFVHNPGNNEDILVFDFGVDIGDTLLFGLSNTALPVEKLRQADFLDGSERTIMSFEGLDLQLLEGIGFTQYPFFLSFITDYSETLSCFYTDTQLVYEANSDFFECNDFFTSVVRTNFSNKLKLWNTNKTIIISGPDLNGLTLTAYSLTGQLLQKGNISSGYFELDVSIPQGMLLCKISDRNKIVHSQLVVLD